MRGLVGTQNVPGVPSVFLDRSAVSGTAYFVDSGASGASDTGGGLSPDSPFATIDAAVSACTATNGDVVFVLPGHAETVAAAITLDIAGVTVIGVGHGRARPVITGLTGIDMITVTADDCHIENLVLSGVSGASSNINVAANDLSIKDCVIEHGAGPLVAVTVASGDNLHISGCRFVGTAAGPDVAIDFESSASDYPVVEDCEFNYLASAGCDLGVIRAAADTVEGGVFQRLNFINVDTVAIDFNSSSSAKSDGIVRDCTITVNGTVASVEDLIDEGGYRFSNVFAANKAGRAVPIPLTSTT